jgi:hypothetical protein
MKTIEEKKEYRRQYHLKNKERIIKAVQLWRKNHKEKACEYVTKWNKKHIESRRANVVKNYQKYWATKTWCRNIARVAKRNGFFKKEPCEVCGNIEVEIHHPDYTEPYMIQWLCHKHHHELHFPCE